MIHVILKYELDPATGGQHAIPSGSRFLSLQVQHDVPVMWWSVPISQIPRADDMSIEAKTRRRAWPLRTFSIVPTGAPGYLDDRLHYVGTFQIGGFVGHVLAWEPITFSQAGVETEQRKGQLSLPENSE